MKVDGFLPIYTLLKILNGNNSIGDPVRNKLNKSRIQILDIKKWLLKLISNHFLGESFKIVYDAFEIFISFLLSSTTLLTSS